MATLEADKYLEELKEAFTDGYMASMNEIDIQVAFDLFVATKIEKRKQQEQIEKPK
jgi:hypothetical protein